MTNQQKAEQLIRERVPELQELSFGCEVRWQDGEYDINKTVIIKGGAGYENYYWDNQGNKFHGEDIEEIIGHPIELHHVLMAIEKYLKEELPNASLIFLNQQMGSYVKPLVTKCHLDKPFNEQSEDLYQFIITTLSK